MRTVVPPASVVLDLDADALVAIATSEPRTLRSHMHARKRWRARPAEHRDPQQKLDSVDMWEPFVGDTAAGKGYARECMCFSGMYGAILATRLSFRPEV